MADRKILGGNNMSTTVFRVEKSREFVVMNNRFLRDKEMSLKAKGLLALCLSLPDSWNYSLNGLCAIVKESQTSVRSALKELEEHKYLKRNKLKDNKGQFYYEYVIFEVPYEGESVDMTESVPHTQNLHTGNLHKENLYVENNRQINIEKESIEEENIEELNLYIQENAYAATWTLLREYLEMRKEIGTPLSIRGLKMLLNRIEKLSNGNITVQRLMLENAIMNKWKNVYKPKKEEITASLEVQVNELKSFYGL